MNERIIEPSSVESGRDEFFNRIIKPIVRNPLVSSAFQRVDRNDFIPSEYRHLSYLNRVVSLSKSSSVSEPTVVALMLELLQLTGQEKVLEVGTASGYNAALLSLCAAEVHTIEYDEILAQKAQVKLQILGYDSVHVHIGDGVQGVINEAPFDRIILTAGAREFPQSLFEQLSEDGVIVGPIGETRDTLRLAVGIKKGNILEVQYGESVGFHLLETSEHGGWSNEAQAKVKKYTIVKPDIQIEFPQIPEEDHQTYNEEILEPRQECLDMLEQNGFTQQEFIDIFIKRGLSFESATGLLALHPEPFRQVLSMAAHHKETNHDL